MPTDCTITFDHSDGIYNSGDTINGHIKLHTTKTKSIRGIYIEVSGHADVQWEESKSRSTNDRTENYTEYYKAHEQYLKSITYVIGQDCGNSFDLLPGYYEQTFNCTLPRELPTSCEEKYGKIKYKVSVTIDRFLRFNNVFERPFTVNHCIDLNWNLENRLSITRSDSNLTCCACCFCGGSGEIRAELTLPYTGIIPGQRFPFQLFIFNDSNTDIEGCKVKFKKVMTFESKTPERAYKYIITELGTKFFNTILRLTRKEFKDYIQIPTRLPCTQLGKCIRIEYFIKGRVFMNCCASDIQIEIPITIGSIPFTDETRNIHDETVITTQPTAPSASIVPENNSLSSIIVENNSLPPVYKPIDLPVDLPSYEDAIQMIDHANDDDRCRENKRVGHKSGLPTAPPDDNNSVVINSNQAQTSSARNYGWT